MGVMRFFELIANKNSNAYENMHKEMDDKPQNKANLEAEAFDSVKPVELNTASESCKL